MFYSANVPSSKCHIRLRHLRFTESGVPAIIMTILLIVGYKSRQIMQKDMTGQQHRQLRLLDAVCRVNFSSSGGGQ